MAKKDDITLIIAKAFSQQNLSKEEKEVCCDLTISELVKEHGLNDIQADHVIKWCAIQQSKLTNQMQKEILEEGLFSTIQSLFSKKPKRDSFYNKNSKIVTKTINTSNLDIAKFLYKAIKLISKIESEGLYKYSKLDSKQEYENHEINEKTLICLKSIFKILSNISIISSHYTRGLSNKKVLENRSRSTQTKDIVALMKSDEYKSMKKQQSIYQQVPKLIDEICKNANVKKSKEKAMMAKYLSYDITSIAKRYEKIYKHEKDNTDFSTTIPD